MQKFFHSVKDAVTAVLDHGRPIRYRTWFVLDFPRHDNIQSPRKLHHINRVAHLKKLVLEDGVPLFCLLKEDDPSTKTVCFSLTFSHFFHHHGWVYSHVALLFVPTK